MLVVLGGNMFNFYIYNKRRIQNNKLNIFNHATFGANQKQNVMKTNEETKEESNIVTFFKFIGAVVALAYGLYIIF